MSVKDKILGPKCPLNVENSLKGLYLIALPPKLANEWAQASDGDTVGTFCIKGKQSSSIDLTIGSKPVTFALEESTYERTQYAIDVNKGTKASPTDPKYSIMGKISKNYKAVLDYTKITPGSKRDREISREAATPKIGIANIDAIRSSQLQPATIVIKRARVDDKGNQEITEKKKKIWEALNTLFKSGEYQKMETIEKHCEPILGGKGRNDPDLIEILQNVYTRVAKGNYRNYYCKKSQE